MATPPTFTVGQVLTAAHMNSIGMWKAIPTSISGTGATLSNNTITLSNCAAVVINGIFTSDFNDYLINVRMSQSGSDVNLQLTSGGTEVATSTYNWSMMQSYAGTSPSVQAARSSSVSSMLIMSNNNGSTGSASVDIFGPQLASPTMFQVNNLRNDGNLQTPANYLLFGNQTNSTSYDGIRIFGPSDMTGTISIYARSK